MFLRNIHIQFSNLFVLLIISLTFSALSASLIFLIPIFVVLGWLIFQKRSVIVGATLVGYLTATSKYTGNLRIYLNILLTIIIIYLFLKEYGFAFHKYPKVPKIVIYFVLLMSFCLLIASLISIDPQTSLIPLITTIFFFTICYLFYSMLKTIEDVYTLIFSIIISTFVLSISIFIDFISLGPAVFFVRGMLSNEIELSSMIRYTEYVVFFISLSFLISFYLIKQNSSNKFKITITLLVLLNLIILIFANSRGSLGAAVISILFIYIYYFRKKIFTYLIIISTLILIAYSSIPILEESTEAYLRLGTVSERELFWNSGVEIFKDFPIFGIGPNLYPLYFASYAPPGVYEHIGFDKITNPTPHNLFLRYAAETGSLGLIVPIFFFIMYFSISVKTLSLTKNSSREYYILTITTTGIGIAMFLRSFIEVTGILAYGYLTLDLPFWIVVVIMIFIYQKFRLNNYNA